MQIDIQTNIHICIYEHTDILFKRKKTTLFCLCYDKVKEKNKITIKSDKYTPQQVIRNKCPIFSFVDTD